MAGTPMPSFVDAANDKEMWDLANYVVSLGRKPVWSMTAQEVADFYARQEAEAKANPVKRGEYLVNTLGCVLCHSPVDQERRMLPGMRLAGGVLFRIEPFGDFPTGNLTSDKETGLGNWTDDRDQARDHQGHAARRHAAAAVPDGLARRSATMTAVGHRRDRRLPAHGAAGVEPGPGAALQVLARRICGASSRC